MKICSHCKQNKALDNFGTRNKRNSNGQVYKTFNCYCKSCNSERAKQRYHNLKTRGIRFVYRLLNEDDEIIYVGKTNSLPTRTNQHFSKFSHIYPKTQGEATKIQYLAMYSTSMMDMREIYYINLYKPKYNTKYMYDEPKFMISEFSKDIWQDYNLTEIKNINKEQLNQAIKSVFKRKRNGKYLVYTEILNIDGKRKQIFKGSFDSEKEATALVKELKDICRLYS